ncbi:cytochrome P450 [Penicillium odoratum]|uniref:cytochrome P450 n=1 Tax=Penicillium odoratum TaxID=1167516 RepID=UPI002546B6FA|nr:cytochrome P450 [Penicillium odoratum]KAJ5759704.1 cytochrome P450 [Penicillium odoratum]
MFHQRHPSSFTLHVFLMDRVFGLPRKALKIYQKDNSGGYPKPISHSKVEPQNRIEYLLKKLVHRFLLGPGLQPFARRFQIDFAQRVQNLAVGNDWVEWDDFVSFYTQDLTASFLNALCGKYLLQKHPDFLTHLWTFENNIWKFVVGLPRFLFPRIYTARGECLAALKSWHTWASQNFDPADVDAAGDDPIWGSKFFRDRKEVLNQVEGFDQDAIATHDFAFIWGATNNVIISAFWTAVEAFKDPKLLSLVREEAKACLLVDQQSDCLQFDMKKLLQQPYLQAMYAETLRLRIGGFLVRHQNEEDLNIEGWRIPRNHYILNNTMHGHMNPDIWSKGTCENHPVDVFWPARFLKPGVDGVSQEFTMEMSKGAWTPYGGGHNTCPGRQHAKMTNIYATALIVLSFDCEIIADSKALEMSMRNFGFGVAAPRGNIPVRIRRR